MQLKHDQSSRSAGGASQLASVDMVWREQTAQPVVFVVEAETPGSGPVLSAALNSAIQCETFSRCSALVAALSASTPDLVVLDVTAEATNAVEALHELSKRSYPGIVQLISQPGVSMVEPIRQLAQLQSLIVLPPLTKPLDAGVLRVALKDLTSKVSQSRAQPIRLEEAIKSGWVQFWYQPKIDLQKKSLIGLEAFARLFHPHKGLMPPSAILNNADDESMTALLHHALVETRAISVELSSLGLKVPISINSTLSALQSVPASQIFREHVAKAGHLRGWIFDVGEEDIAKHRPTIQALGPLFRSAGIRLAIDNFSGRILPRATLDELPIAELKLNPKYIAHCHTQATHADVCRALIQLAHGLQSVAVAVGVETPAQAQALQQIGCDVGQGFLYGHPLPLEQLIAMIKQRVATQHMKAAVRAV